MRERERDFSLGLREIRPSTVFGTRRKDALREGLRVGTVFREFPRTPRGRGFILLILFLV